MHFFVVKFDLSAAEVSDSITVWVDPALGSGDPAGGMTLTDLNIAFDSLAFSDYACNSVIRDELWSTSLALWHASGATSGGATFNFSSVLANHPSGSPP